MANGYGTPLNQLGFGYGNSGWDAERMYGGGVMPPNNPALGWGRANPPATGFGFGQNTGLMDGDARTGRTGLMGGDAGERGPMSGDAGPVNGTSFSNNFGPTVNGVMGGDAGNLPMGGDAGPGLGPRGGPSAIGLPPGPPQLAGDMGKGLMGGDAGNIPMGGVYGDVNPPAGGSGMASGFQANPPARSPITGGLMNYVQRTPGMSGGYNASGFGGLGATYGGQRPGIGARYWARLNNIGGT